MTINSSMENTSAKTALCEHLMVADKGLRVNDVALATILKITSTCKKEHKIEDIRGGNRETNVVDCNGKVLIS